RGTMNARDLAVKFASYEQYLASREWVNEHSALPRLVCVVPDIAQERRMHHVAQTKLAQIRGVEILTTTEELLNDYGSHAPIWSRSIPQERGRVANPHGSLRQRLFT